MDAIHARSNLEAPLQAEIARLVGSGGVSPVPNQACLLLVSVGDPDFLQPHNSFGISRGIVILGHYQVDVVNDRRLLRSTYPLGAVEPIPFRGDVVTTTNPIFAEDLKKATPTTGGGALHSSDGRTGSTSVLDASGYTTPTLDISYNNNYY